MEQKATRELLEKVARGAVSVEEAVLKLKEAPFEDLGFAKLDNHRALRQGMSEVIYGAGKTAQQIIDIVKKMQENSQDTILITRLSEEKAAIVKEVVDFTYYPMGNIGVVGTMPQADGLGTIVIATGGTSDMPVAEEAAITARVMGNQVERLYDVGVAGLERLLSNMDVVMNASVIIVLAGMEGALASVVGGLADCPIIAVPTSVGYGASFHGISALLSMLNSCASGVSVVNIDNGFGAAFQASRINHMREK
ncbi:MAG: nickel pincer cofactor biosynthesis protein LarB [Acidaminococcaceae bacterium]|jgi:NCAIR mutase (PurE)-related protein|nr:nickel pincer cofactor biosynthesis protein LarB [Acidaminococcaceae bacterium]